MNYVLTLILVPLLFGAGCARTPQHPSNAPLEWIEAAPANEAAQGGFILRPSGRTFVPWGFNYDRDYRSRLLEDYWQTEWPIIVEDFAEMKRLGANAARIHLQFGKLMLAPDRPDPAALARLAKLLELAEQTGLYLDLTGLACYRRADSPEWYQALPERERWAAQAAFWEAVAQTGARSPAVFCYDLMNEPMVPAASRRAGDWLTGELGGFVYCQFITLSPAGRPREQIATEWIRCLTSAIRKHDRRHLITVGLLPNSNETPGSGFSCREIGPELDFISVHFYPKSGQLAHDLQVLRGFAVGRPVVIEEMFPLACSTAELEEFVRRSQPYADGWFGFYWGQLPEELDPAKSLGEAITREFLQWFRTARGGGVLPKRPPSGGAGGLGKSIGKTALVPEEGFEPPTKGL